MNYDDVFRYLYPIYCRAIGRNSQAALSERLAVAAGTKDTIHTYRFAKLRRVIDNAYNHVPYYSTRFREMGFHPDDIRSFDDFRALDFHITKADVKDNIQDFISRQANPRQLCWHRTGGSTGDPLVYPTDKQTDAASATALMRALQWWGVEFGAPHAQFWGSPSFIERKRSDVFRSSVARIRNRLMNRLFILNYNISAENVPRIHKEILDFKPIYVRGMPTSLYIYAKLVKKMGLTYPHNTTRVVFSACEQLFDWQKTEIEEVFGCRVANTYGLSELGDVAYEGPCGHLHLIEDDVFTELRPMSDGLGEIVTTQMNNMASPLIKYRTGDVAERIIDSPCDLNERVIENIRGRAHDFIIAPDGRFLHGQFLTHLIVYEDGIDKYQVVQKERTHLDIIFVTSSAYDKASEEKIRASIKRYMGNEMVVTYSYVDHIPLTKAGKHRWIISQLGSIQDHLR